jgi:prevent-host-death family protein
MVGIDVRFVDSLRYTLYKYIVQTANLAMKTINISEFRANLLKYLEIANSGELISVTSNGKMLATVCSPINRQQTAREQLQAIAETAQIGDVISPQDEEWEAQV